MRVFIAGPSWVDFGGVTAALTRDGHVITGTNRPQAPETWPEVLELIRTSDQVVLLPQSEHSWSARRIIRAAGESGIPVKTSAEVTSPCAS